MLIGAFPEWRSPSSEYALQTPALPDVDQALSIRLLLEFRSGGRVASPTGPSAGPYREITASR
jgi:hypothetical protein